jgi:hypothetical protein
VQACPQRSPERGAGVSWAGQSAAVSWAGRGVVSWAGRCFCQLSGALFLSVERDAGAS